MNIVSKPCVNAEWNPLSENTDTKSKWTYPQSPTLSTRTQPPPPPHFIKIVHVHCWSTRVQLSWLFNILQVSVVHNVLFSYRCFILDSIMNMQNWRSWVISPLCCVGSWRRGQYAQVRTRPLRVWTVACISLSTVHTTCFLSSPHASPHNKWNRPLLRCYHE